MPQYHSQSKITRLTKDSITISCNQNLTRASDNAFWYFFLETIQMKDVFTASLLKLIFFKAKVNTNSFLYMNNLSFSFFFFFHSYKATSISRHMLDKVYWSNNFYYKFRENVRIKITRHDQNCIPSLSAYFLISHDSGLQICFLDYPPRPRTREEDMTREGVNTHPSG